MDLVKIKTTTVKEHWDFDISKYEKTPEGVGQMAEEFCKLYYLGTVINEQKAELIFNTIYEVIKKMGWDVCSGKYFPFDDTSWHFEFWANFNNDGVTHHCMELSLT